MSDDRRSPDAAEDQEPPVCEKCGERHYGRSHPWRAIKHKPRPASDAATTLGPRAAAYERMRAAEVCEREGHLPEEIEWYERDRSDRPCRRGCGESVRPKIDYSGHP